MKGGDNLKSFFKGFNYRNLSLGVSIKIFQIFFIVVIGFFLNSCSKTGEMLGIDIPEDNVVDNAINDSIYYPFRDQMCDWGFRVSGCEDNETNISSTNESYIPENNPEENLTCQDGYKLVGGLCVKTSTEDVNKLKDVESKWYDILTVDQKKMVREDQNNINPKDDTLTVLTLLDPYDGEYFKMLKNTKVVLPYYIYNKKDQSELAFVTSSDEKVINPNIIDSSNGVFKVVDSNSILFLELEARGEANQTASISLKVQEEDATRYDKEKVDVLIIDKNETYTYNPVSLFFTYNTIIIEEYDSRNIYFGISYTIDSNVTVLVRSDVEKFLADKNKTLDLQNLSAENNNVVSAIVSNDNGVPFYFRLDAKGKAGDTMELFLVAIDSHGNYDFKKFTVLIVGKGQGGYTSSVGETGGTGTETPTIIGDDWNKLSATQQALVNEDLNNYDKTSDNKPVITIFNPSNLIKIVKGTTLTTSFYVKDNAKDTIQTIVYDDIKKVKANIENYGKFTITNSNKLFFLNLEAVGNVGDITDIIVYSQKANDKTYFDQESFKVEIVANEDEASYIEPMLYVGFRKLYIEEGGYRTGLQFSIVHSKDVEPEIIIGDTNVVQFLEWVSKDPPKFSIKAVGKEGDRTTLTIKVDDGKNVDEIKIDVIIIPKGTLNQYIEEEHTTPVVTTPTTENKTDQTNNNNTDNTNTSEQTNNTDNTNTTEQTNNTDNTNTSEQTNNTDKTNTTCAEGQHLENGQCVADVSLLTCNDGFVLKDGECVSETNESIKADPVCEDGYHVENGQCISNIKEPICAEGQHLENGQCVADDTGQPVTPICEDGYHLEDNQCVADKVDPICQEGYHLSNGECVSDSNTNDKIPPICDDGYHLNEEKVCVVDLVCEDGQHIENGQCVEDLKTCDEGYHAENGVCVADTPSCEDGYHLENGECIPNEVRSDDELKQVPYNEWTEKEQSEKSLEVCYLKLEDENYQSLVADESRAEGFSNNLGTLVFHTEKPPVVNGINQNVKLTMIYKERYTADPNGKMLDATYRVPRFRIDYVIDFSGDTFYIIDDEDGKCYVNTFPSENTVPFGLLELVKPDWAN